MGHKTQEELLEILNLAKEKVKVGAKYFHYKHPDQFYIVVEVAFLEASETPAVVYKAQYGDGISWIRPIDDFLATVEIDGKQVARFTLAED